MQVVVKSAHTHVSVSFGDDVTYFDLCGEGRKVSSKYISYDHIGIV